MRLAVVIGSTYKKSSQLAPLPSARFDRELVAERLADGDVGFQVERLPANGSLRARLKALLADHPREQAGDSVLIYISGYCLVRDGEAELCLDGRKGGSLPLRVLKKWLSTEAGDACVVLDAVHQPDPDDIAASACLVQAARDALTPKRSGISAVLAASPSDRTVADGPSLFTRLWLLSLDQMSPSSSRTGAVTFKHVFDVMRANRDRFVEIPAAGYFAGASDFALMFAPSMVVADDEPSPVPSQRLQPAPESARDEPRVLDVSVLTELGDDAAAEKRFAEAVEYYKRALLAAGSKRDHGRAELYLKLGRTKLALGSAAEAILNLDKVLAIEPLHQEAFETARRLLLKEKDLGALDRLYRRRLENERGLEERRVLLAALAEIWFEAGEPAKAASAAKRWLEDEAESQAALQCLARAERAQGRFASAVQALTRLAELREGSERAESLVLAAQLSAEHLPNKDQALELAKQALAADPTALAALEVAVGLYAKRRRWRELSELYALCLESTRDPTLTWDLGKKLGLLMRDELDDLEGARRGFARALSANPADLDLYFFLGELYEAEREHEKAAEIFRRGAGVAPDNSELTRRALWMFEKTAQHDAAFHAASVLECLGEADINESLLANTHRPDGLLAVQSKLCSRDLLELSPVQDRALERVLSSVCNAAVSVQVAKLEARGKLRRLDAAQLVDPETSTATIARSLKWVAHLFGVAPPKLYVLDDLPSEIVAVPAREQTVAVQRSLASGRSLAELAFLWARQLSYCVPEHYLLVFYPSLRDLAALLLAALALGGSEDEEPASLDGEVANLSRALDAELSDEERSALCAAVENFEAKRTRSRIVSWARGVQLAANRAGLLATGNLELAVQLVRQNPENPDLGAESEVADLYRFALSRQHGELRAALGVAL